MAQNITPYVVQAPGFFGLNTQDSPTSLEAGWALTATNCVIDQYGRIGARKGWTKAHTASTELGSANVRSMGEMITTDGTHYIFATGNNKLFKLNGGSLVELTYGGGGTAPVITGDNWKVVSLDGFCLFFQLGHDPLAFQPSVSTTTYKRLSEVSGYAGTVQHANSAISAYGRVWNANTTTDKVTVQWCDTKNPLKWNTGTAGTLDLTSVWPSGGDSIVALGAHNGFLFIFGSNHILIYQGATDPSTMTLYDTVTGIGCIGRDSVANTGSDLIFLSQTGVRSVLRTIQEKSAPLRDLSKNIRSDLIRQISGETASNIKASYCPKEAFYLLSLPTSQVVYCFDTKQMLPDGAARVTTWDNINPTAIYSAVDGTVYLGKAGYVATYSGYLDDSSTYRMVYYTSHADFGAPTVTSVLKRLSIVVIGGTGQGCVLKWAYDFTSNFRSQSVSLPFLEVAEYGISEYNIAEYNDGVLLATLSVHPSGSGKVVQLGFEAEIDNNPLSLQKLEVLTKNGKVV